MPAFLSPSPKFRAFDTNGNPLVGGKLYSYVATTLTPLATYVDSGKSAENTNPVILDASGSADVWLDGNYKLVLTDANDVPVWTVDSIDSSSGDDALEAKFNAALLYQAGPVSNRPTPDVSLGATNNGILFFAEDEGKVYRWNGSTWLDKTNNIFPPRARTGALYFTIDGGGSVPSTGIKGHLPIPVACTITGWTITADGVGSAVVDVAKTSFSAFTFASINGGDPPTLSAAQKNQNLTLSAWTTALAANDVIQFSLSSVATCTRISISLFVTIPGEV